MENITNQEKITLGLLIGAAFTMFSSFTIIKTSEVGIRSKFGMISSDKVLEEGFHFKFPFIESIEKVSIKQHQETAELETQTSDLQPARIKYQVMYSIPANMVISNKKTFNGDIFDVLLKKRADESIRDALAQYPAEELIINRGQISTKVKSRLIERVKNHVEIDDIAILSFDFANDKWLDSVNNKVKAKQDAETAEIKKQQSQAEADQILIKAKAEAQAIKITANAISDNPKIIELEKIKKWNGIVPLDAKTVVIGDKSLILRNND